MKPFNCAEFSTIIDKNYVRPSLASCVSIESKHAPLLVLVYLSIVKLMLAVNLKKSISFLTSKGKYLKKKDNK